MLLLAHLCSSLLISGRPARARAPGRVPGSAKSGSGLKLKLLECVGMLFPAAGQDGQCQVGATDATLALGSVAGRQRSLQPDSESGPKQRAGFLTFFVSESFPFLELSMFAEIRKLAVLLSPSSGNSTKSSPKVILEMVVRARSPGFPLIASRYFYSKPSKGTSMSLLSRVRWKPI